MQERLRLWLAVAMCVPFAATAANPQEPQKAPVGPPAEIVLPSRLVASAPATLAVLDAEGRLVPSVKVNLSAGMHAETDFDGRAEFVVPASPNGPGALVARIEAQPEIAAAAVVLPPAPAKGPNISAIPDLISRNDRFEVRGEGFRGDASGNRILMGDSVGLALAASPVALLVLANPQTAPGPAQLQIWANGAKASAATTVVTVELEANTAAIEPGRTSRLVVHLRGTTQREEIEVRNLSPETVQFAHGVNERVRTRGGADNSATIKVKWLRTGDYSFRARLVSRAGRQPDVDQARDLLIAAQKGAPGDWPHRLDGPISLLEKQKPDIDKTLKQLDALIAAGPGGDTSVLLRAARKVL